MKELAPAPSRNDGCNSYPIGMKEFLSIRIIWVHLGFFDCEKSHFLISYPFMRVMAIFCVISFLPFQMLRISRYSGSSFTFICVISNHIKV